MMSISESADRLCRTFVCGVGAVALRKRGKKLHVFVVLKWWAWFFPWVRSSAVDEVAGLMAAGIPDETEVVVHLVNR